MTRAIYVRLLMGLALAATAADAADEIRAPALEEVVVYGRAQQLLGIAGSASEGVVGYDDLGLPPLLRVGELAESVPGMVATQHSGTGKANQYFLRGFNLDHGTDFSASAEGVPLNMRTHGHGQGYLDLNFLIPELVATAVYQKGPYSPAVGDFSSAGSVQFEFHDRLEESFGELSVGENGYRRGLLAGTAELAGGTLTGAADVTRYDAPFVLDENLRQEKGYLSFVDALAGMAAKLTLQGYSGRWDSSDQIPLRAVRSGRISERGYIDPDLGGATQRFAVTGSLTSNAWSATAYLVDYDLTLFSNFTYFLEDPESGDEFEQRDDRRIYGARIDGVVETSLAGLPLVLRWGGDARYDDIAEVGLYRTFSRERTGVVRQDAVDEWSVALHGKAEWAATERLRLALGLRADYFDWQVDAFREINSGSGHARQVSPKLMLAYRFAESAEVYVNYGIGMHSNDVRGATIRVDPSSAEPAAAVDPLVKSEGGEIGVRLESGSDFNVTMTAFQLALDSELLFIGDAGGTEATYGSERRGIETAAFWRPADWLAVNTAYTYTDARFRGAPPGEDHIPGAIEQTFAFGVDAVWKDALTMSLEARYLGDAPLVEDGSVRAQGSTLVNAGLALRRDALEWRLDAFNLLDSNDYDISYFYASRLPGEPAGGVEDIHFHPLEPRTVRLSVSYYW